MNNIVDILPELLLRNTLLVAVVGVVILLALRSFRPQAAWIHRIGWSIVLLQGVLLTPLTLDIPWYPPPAATSSSPEAATNAASEFDAITTANVTAAAPMIHGNQVLSSDSWSWRSWLLGIWISGALAVVAYSLLCYCLLVWRVRSCPSAPSAWQSQWVRLRSDRGIDSPIRLVVDDRMGPMLCRLPGGYVVVIPELLWQRLSESQRAAILQHELAHYVRGDVWKSLFARLLALAQWFNPFAWWAVRKFEETSEWACDSDLAAVEPRHVPEFAKALLTIVERTPRRICTSLATGSPLAIRLKRLLVPKQKDSPMKRCILSTLFLALLLIGLFRVQLVAQEPEKAAAPKPPATIDSNFEKAAAEFAARLTTDQESLKKLKQALKTPAGQIVLRDRISKVEETLRQKARATALPSFVSKVFEKKAGGLQVRTEHTKLRDRLIAETNQFQSDIQRMKKVLLRMSEETALDSDVNKLAARFLKHDASATVLYFDQVRKGGIEPAKMLILRKLSQIFVPDKDGNYLLREAALAQAKETLARFDAVERSIKYLKKEMGEWSMELADTDELHKRLAKTINEPTFSSYMAAQILAQPKAKASTQLAKFFKHLEEITVDTGDGISIRKERRMEFEALIAKHDLTSGLLKRIKPSLQDFADKIKPTDELHKRWRALLKTDYAAISLSREAQSRAVTLEKATEMLMGRVIAKGEDGKYRVTAEEPEKVTTFMQQAFRQYRSLRRQARTIDSLVDQVADEELKNALDSLVGKYMLLTTIQRSVSADDVNGMKQWIDHHFDEVDGKLALKEGFREMVDAMLTEIADVTKELSNDDF